jgi:hypothetical protein
MNTKQFLAPAIALFLFACKDTKKSEPVAPVVTNDTVVNTDVTTCYRFTQKKDTILLTLKTIQDASSVGMTKAQSVTGNLSYNYYEKDQNTGTIAGTITGDILRADYTFQSEGVESKRQVAFKKVGDDWVEGHEEMEMKDDKLVFKSDSLDYTGKTVLKLVDCR